MSKRILQVRCIWHEEKTPSLVLQFPRNQAYCLSCGRQELITEIANELKEKRGIDIGDDFANREEGFRRTESLQNGFMEISE